MVDARTTIHSMQIEERSDLVELGEVSKPHEGNKESFEAHASYLRDAFDGVTKVIQLVEAKLGSGYLSMGQEDAEAGGRKERRSDYKSGGAQLPKSKASVRKDVDSEEHHSAVEADLPIAKEGTQMQGNRLYGHGLGSTMVSQRRDFRGVIDPLLSWRESIGRKRGRGGGNAKANSKYQDRAEGQRTRNFIRSVSIDFSSK
ncbi:hypothetical protein GW17_00030551 [Ensete ventricosum]|nr:hypothetical protein GW17_00030551 [Ensete ventricosum]